MKVTISKRLLSFAVTAALVSASLFIIPANGEPFAYAKGAKEAALPNAGIAAAGFTAGGVYYSILPGSARVQVGNGENAAIPADSAASINIPATVLNGGTSYTVTAIAAYAFRGCAISGVTLPDSVRIVGNRAFMDCRNLTSINLPTGLQSIEHWAFSGSGLTGVTIPDSVAQILNGAFSSMPRLESAVFGDGITVLGDSVFLSSANLSSVTLPANLKRIDGYAFYGCGKLNNIVIPASVEYIDRNAFKGCVSMSDMVFSSAAPPEISPYDVFANCDKLSAVHVPGGSASAYMSALRGAGLIAEVYNEATVKIYSCFRSDGVTYKVLSLSPNRVQVGSGSERAIASAGSGTINIPGEVIYDGIRFAVTGVGDSAFLNAAISGVRLPDSVKYIGTSAFYNCANLEGIELPENLETIANYAFYRSGLRSVVLPDSVTLTGWSIFSGATRLESATIGDGITSLANGMFNGCSSLTNVTLTNSITRLENSAFSDCVNLASISLPASLEYIGSYAFSNCSALTDISMPASLRAIDMYAFSACSELTDISFAGTSPPSLNGNTIFLDCDSLDLIHVPADSAGAYRERLMDAGLATSVMDETTLKALHRFSVDGVKYKVISTDPRRVQVGDGFSPAVPSTRSGSVIVPETVEHGGVNYEVTAVGRNAFTNCALSGVSLPDSVTSIGYMAFYGCGNLSEIDLPPNLNSIDGYAFYVSGLVSVSIPGSVTNFGDRAFAYSARLSKVVIGEGVSQLAADTFAGCTALTSVSLPDNLKNISSAFAGCSSLENISLPPALETIEPFAFSRCTKLREISIPASVSSIGLRAFAECVALEEITFGGADAPAISNEDVFVFARALDTIRVPSGSASRYLPVLTAAGLTVSVQDNATLKVFKSFELNGVTYKVVSAEPPMVQVGNGIAQAISSYRTDHIVIPGTVSNAGVVYEVTAVAREAFAVCNISGLTLPSGITSIGEMAFAISKIKEIFIPGSVTHFGSGIFFMAYELERAEIGEGIAELPNGIFNHCKGLYSVKLPDTLKRISNSAFNDCPNLQEISIPASVEYIGNSVFNACRELASITFEGKTPPELSASNVFEGCISLEKVLVPRGTLDAYRRALTAAGIPESIIMEYGGDDGGGEPVKPTEPAVKPPVDKGKGGDKGKGSKPGLNEPPSRNRPLDFSKLSAGAFKIADKAWTGKRIKSGLRISVSYSVNGKLIVKALRENVDYSVTGYGKNKNIGKGTITITGKAGSVYKAAKALTFKIVPKKPTALKLKAGKKSLKVTFRKVSKSQKVKTYRVQYKIKGAKKWRSKTVRVKLTGKAGKKKTVSLTLKRLKSKKTYQVRVYAYKGAYKGMPTKSKNRKIR